MKIQKYMIESITEAFLLLFVFWTIGYFANALLGMEFEIRSCWDGFTTLGGAGVLATVKYVMDSWKNSFEGERPYDNTGTAQPNPARNAGGVGVPAGVQGLCMGTGVHGGNESGAPKI